MTSDPFTLNKNHVRMTEMMTFIKTLFIPSLLIVIGGGSILWSIYDYNRYWNSHDWPETKAKGKIIDFGSFNFPQITYSYESKGERFTSKKIAYYPIDGMSSLNAINTYSKIEEDDKITVYLNPDDPSESILIKGHQDFSFQQRYGPQVILGAMLFLLGLYFVRRRIKRKAFFQFLEKKSTAQAR